MPIEADDARAAIEGRFFARWTADSVTLRTPVAIENVAGLFTTVDRATTIPAPPHDAIWARLTIREADGLQKDLASAARIRVPGRIYVDVFAPKGTGTGAVKALGDLLPAIFERTQFNGISTRARAPRELGEDAHWWGYQVAFPYWRDPLSS